MSGPLNFDDGSWPGCYRPVIDGLRHLTWLPKEPPAGTSVVLVDGDQFVVGSKRSTPAIYDCHICADEWLVQSTTPAHQVPSQSASCPLVGRAIAPVGAGDPDPAPTGLPQEHTWRRP